MTSSTPCLRVRGVLVTSLDDGTSVLTVVSKMELTIDQALQQGRAAHKEGKLQEAERLYRAILQAQPAHPHANHNLGVIAVSANKAEAALRLFKTALEANPKILQFWLSYIDTLIRENHLETAKQVIVQGKNKGINSKKFDALNQQLLLASNNELPSQSQLNNLLEQYQKGQYGDAEKLAISITEKFPRHHFSWKILGAVFKQTGRVTESLGANQRAAHLDPEDAEVHSNLGVALKELGRIEEAEASYRRAIELKPDYVEAHINLGVTLFELDRLEDAEARFRETIALKPDFFEAHSNLGNTLKDLGRLEEAEASHKQALALNPENAEVHRNLGVTLKELGRLEDAESSYRQALALNSDFAEAHNNLGVTLQELGRLEESEASLRQAIALKPDFAEAWNNLGNTLQSLSRLEDAEASYRQALAFKPDLADVLWNLSSLAKTVVDAEHWVGKCLKADANNVRAKLTKTALRFYQGDRADFDNLMQSKFKDHSYMRSFSWVFSLPNLPKLYFNKWSFYDAIAEQSVRSRPFYEFGVWRASSFKYLIKLFKKGYGFDTFTGLPEDWDSGISFEKGSYSSDGNVPNIKGGEFIVGKFEDTLPIFFAKNHPLASVINFDADLYSSTICALNFSKSVMDKDTVLIFDELIMNESWEQDEFKALNEFCSTNHYTFEVLAISFFSKQVAVKLIGI